MEVDRLFWVDRFDQICRKQDIEIDAPSQTTRGSTGTGPPRTEFGIELMNGILKEATVTRYDYANNDQFRRRFTTTLDAYNFTQLLKILRSLTRYEATCQVWADSLVASGTIQPSLPRN